MSNLVFPFSERTILAEEGAVGKDHAKARIVVSSGNEHSAKVVTPGSDPITDVIGKNGHGVITTTNVNGTGYSHPTYYE